MVELRPMDDTWATPDQNMDTWVIHGKSLDIWVTHGAV